ncbi:MAG: two-component system, NarL family, response regulator NreC [Solirubrobacteraceae bacterium]|nr:two-component system, NarL family, response regulator NreC [Solirubrobacteraceae bacterium]
MHGRPRFSVVIADDHAVVRQGLRLLLESEADLEVIGEAGDLEETGRLVGELTPDILLLDLHMGRELSLGWLERLRAASPRTGVVILTMQDDPAFARQALAGGAAGYVLKETSRSELARAIRTVAKGGTYLDPAVGVGALSSRGPASLTERETEVLRLLALGHTNAEIGKLLFVSVRTVETHRANLQRKLAITGRPELVQYALKRGVIHP